MPPDLRTLPANLTLRAGSHPIPDEMCVMEAVAYVAGEPHSDHPTCACPVISDFLQSWNDGIPDDATRTRLLLPLVPRLVGTRATPEVEERRSYLATDWLIRIYTSAWLDLVPTLRKHAAALRSLPEIVNLETAAVAGVHVRAARDAGAAAGDAAGAAARAAAWGGDDLAPTVAHLQASALALVDRMISLTPTED